MAVSKSYSVEFDDSLLDMASWKNPRYNGSKLLGSQINKHVDGDPIYSYGLKPIIENKACAIFIGNSIEQGEVTSSLDPLVDINNHSYVTIDTILLVDLQTLKSTKRGNLNHTDLVKTIVFPLLDDTATIDELSLHASLRQYGNGSCKAIVSRAVSAELNSSS